MMAVKIMPARMPSRGLEKLDMMLTKASDSRRGAMAALIISMPMNSTPRPAKICPMCCSWGFLHEDHQHHARKGDQRGQLAHVQGDQQAGDGGADVGAHDDPDRLVQGHHAGVDKGPTTITVVAEDDWITAVMAAPHQYAQKSVGGEALQDLLHPAARRGPPGRSSSSACRIKTGPGPPNRLKKVCHLHWLESSSFSLIP